MKSVVLQCCTEHAPGATQETREKWDASVRKYYISYTKFVQYLQLDLKRDEEDVARLEEDVARLDQTLDAAVLRKVRSLLAKSATSQTTGAAAAQASTHESDARRSAPAPPAAPAVVPQHQQTAQAQPMPGPAGPQEATRSESVSSGGC